MRDDGSGASTRSPRIVIVGAGFGGIAVAALLRRAGFADVTVLEKADRVGGVWRDNTYPGCACDIPAPLYSYSFAPNPDWSRRFPPRSEILAYLERCVADFGLDRRDPVRRRRHRSAVDRLALADHVRGRHVDGRRHPDPGDGSAVPTGHP